jgi:SAM-dependent methyltransferase
MSDPQRPWYEAWFDRDEYEIVYRHRDDEEAARLISLPERATGADAGESVVDIGCGRGRHAIRLALHGYRVTGLDLSERSIEMARERAASERQEVRFVVGDMRNALCSSCFDGAVNLFTAFGYFEEEVEHQRAIDAIARSLKPGAWFFQDFLNADYVRETFVPEDRRREGDVDIVQRRRIDDGRIRKTITLIRDGEQRSFEESVRLLELRDFIDMYDRSGLRLMSVYGDYDGHPYGPGSPRMIMYSVKDQDS